MKNRTIMIASAVIALLGVLAINRALPVSAQDDPVVTIEPSTTTTTTVDAYVDPVCDSGSIALPFNYENTYQHGVTIEFSLDGELAGSIVGVPPGNSVPTLLLYNVQETQGGILLVSYSSDNDEFTPFNERISFGPGGPCEAPPAEVCCAQQDVNDDPYADGPKPTVQPPAYMTPRPLSFAG